MVPDASFLTPHDFAFKTQWKYFQNNKTIQNPVK